MCVLEDGHVTTIAVDPRWHRYKLGTRLLLALARGGIDEGAQNLTLEVRASNRGAQALYQRFGFVPAGIRRSEEHTSELQSLMRTSYAVFCLTKKNNRITSI